MRSLWVVAMLGTGCTVDLDYASSTVEFEIVSPQAAGGGAQPIAANGPFMMILGANSKDGGATWALNNAAISNEFAFGAAPDQLVVNTTQFGYGRWDKATDVVSSINPPFAIGGVFARRGTATILSQLPGTATIGRQTKNGVWSMSTVPMPPTAPPGPTPNIYGFDATDTAVYFTSDWGVYRSGDDGASWGFLVNPNLGVTRPLALPDGRIGLMNQSYNQIVGGINDAGVDTTITSFSLPSATATTPAFSCVGALVSGSQYTTDLGVTWASWTPPNATSGIAACGGDYLLGFVTQPQTLLFKTPVLGQFGDLLAVDIAGFSSPLGTAGTSVRLPDGTVLANGLAWKPGDANWSLRPLPLNYSIYVLGDTVLALRPDRAEIQRSTDGGVSWTTVTLATPVPPLDHILADSEGTYWGSRGVSNGTFTAELWKSTDAGETWTKVFEQVAPPTMPGVIDLPPVLRFITPDDTFVAATGPALHVSHDKGETWTANPMPRSFQIAWETPRGYGVTYDPSDDGQKKSFHLWRDHGLGAAFKEVVPLVPTDMGPMPAGDFMTFGVLDDLQIDSEGRVHFFYMGSEYRTKTSIEPAIAGS